jgi:AAA ATPase domain
MLAGRVTECARLDRLLQTVRTGQSEVLVLHGEPGIGKSALLGYAVERARPTSPGAGRLGSHRKVVGDQRRRQDKREDGCEEEKDAEDGDERRRGALALVLSPVQIADIAFDGADGST